MAETTSEKSRPPSVDALARQLANHGSGRTPHVVLVDIARTAIERWRIDRTGDATEIAIEMLDAVAFGRPERIVNATGVLLHTNLGRAPLHPEAAAAAAEVAVGYSNVEIEIATGRRGGRHAYISKLLTTLTGAEAAIVVNNNAGALLLSLAALAAPRGVAVSRGELIEIGGSFRLPELMAASGAHLIEVGTTNRTRLSDFAAAEQPAAFLKVHPSNYRVEGFSEEVGYAELAALATERGIPCIADVGSGLLDSNTPWLPGAPPLWTAQEPGVRQTVATGANVVLFSGDKLIGGPQCGIAVGTADAIQRMSKHPMMRALRIDGPTLAALSVTLELYGTGRGHEVPFWTMSATDTATLATRLEAIRTSIGGAGLVIDGTSLPGAGSVPGETIATPVLELTDDVDAIWETMLQGTPSVLARRNKGTLIIDLRTVAPEDDAAIVNHIIGATAPAH